MYEVFFVFTSTGFYQCAPYTWLYPTSKEVLAAARLKPIGEYIALRRQRAAALVVQRPVMEACRNTEAICGTSICQYWWDQAIDWDLAEDAAKCRATRIALCRAAVITAREEPEPGPPNNIASPGSVRGPIMGTGLYVNAFAATATTIAAEGGRIIALIPDAAEAEGGPPTDDVRAPMPGQQGRVLDPHELTMDAPK